MSKKQDKAKTPKKSPLAKWFHERGYEPIPPREYYRFMFPEGELVARADDPTSQEANKEWKYNAIVIENTHVLMQVNRQDKNGNLYKCDKERWKQHIVTDDLEFIDKVVKNARFGATDSEYYLAPNSYLGRKRTKANERWVYACIIEVDNPIKEGRGKTQKQLGVEQLFWDWTKSSLPYAMPSACVCSGSGLHLVYFLDRPYCITEEAQKVAWDNFRQKFTEKIWSRYVTKEPIQYENHCQSFRMVGTRSKKGHLVEAFWLSKKRYTLEELFAQAPYDDVPTFDNFEDMVKAMAKDEKLAHRLMEAHRPPEPYMLQQKVDMPKGERVITPRMAECMKLYEDWYRERIIEKKPKKEKGQWKTARKTYEWYLRTAKEGAKEGCRYNRVHALACFAVKCGIPYEEFKKDADELYEILKGIAANDPFKYGEYIQARDSYFDPIAHKSTRDWIEKNCWIPMEPPARRNGNSRKEHLHAPYLIDKKTEKRRINTCKINRELALEDARDNGDITGRPILKEIVEKWREENPHGTKAQCIRETGLSKPTVYKWWEA